MAVVIIMIKTATKMKASATKQQQRHPLNPPPPRNLKGNIKKQQKKWGEKQQTQPDVHDNKNKE